MRVKNAFTGLLAAAVLVCLTHSTQAASGVSDSTRSNGHEKLPVEAAKDSFDAKFVLTLGQEAFLREWNQSTTTPRLPTVSAVKLGDTVSTFVVFKGCRVSNSGKCDLRVTYGLTGSNAKYQELGAGYLWLSEPLAGKYMLGSASVEIQFTEPEEAGDHIFHARIVDRVAGTSYELKTPLQVVP